MSRCLQNMDRPCLYFQRSPNCCCRKQQRTILGIFLAVFSIGIIFVNIDRPSQIYQKQDEYVYLTITQPTCTSYCGGDLIFQIGVSQCCNYNTSICQDKMNCYNQNMASFNAELIQAIALLVGAFAYLSLFIIYHLLYCLRKAMRAWRPRQQPMREPGVVYINQQSEWQNGEPDASMIQRLIGEADRNDRNDLRQSVPYRDSRNNCSICLQNFQGSNVIKLKCDHIYHSNCIKDWVKRHKTCPLCRAST